MSDARGVLERMARGNTPNTWALLSPRGQIQRMRFVQAALRELVEIYPRNERWDTPEDRQRKLGRTVLAITELEL
jgi:hypothetical protein